ncbi:MAG: amidohydrolase family protein [Vicinamibacteria bacterium]
MKHAALVFALLAAGDAAPAQEKSLVIQNARVVTVEGPTLERGTVVITGGRIAAVGADVTAPAGATVIDAAGKTLYPGLVDGLTTLGLTEIGSVPGSVDTTEVGDVNPHAKAWVAVHPHSELIPVARANGITTALAAPTGGLVSGQSALVRLAGDTPESLIVKAPAAMHAAYPSGQPPFDITRLFDEPELKTLDERLKEKRKNQEKELQRLATLLAEAKAYGAGVAAAKGGPAVPDLPMEALAPVARGELPLVMRADAEEEIRGAVAFASAHGLKLVIAGGLEAWRCADLLKQKDVAVLTNVDRLPRRQSDPYDAAYANPAALHRAGVRFAIVSDDASLSRNLPYEAAMARAFGLPADAALRAITLSPAEIFGAADRIGSIAVGKAANLFLATGDVMDARVQVTDVFVDGVPQSMETRHTRLYKEFKDR